MAAEEGWETFVIPPNVGGRYSVLTAVGLLPMAVAGIDPMEVLRGAAQAKKEYDIRSFENPVWLYAATRNMLYRNGKVIEILEAFELLAPDKISEANLKEFVGHTPIQVMAGILLGIVKFRRQIAISQSAL